MTEDFIDRVIAAQTAETDRVVSAASIGNVASAGTIGTASVNDFLQSFAATEMNNSKTNALPPIELRATVELDGDVIGETVMEYLDRRSRITNGAG